MVHIPETRVDLEHLNQRTRFKLGGWLGLAHHTIPTCGILKDEANLST